MALTQKFRQLCPTEICHRFLIFTFCSVMNFRRQNVLADKIFRQQVRFSVVLSTEILSDKRNVIQKKWCKYICTAKSIFHIHKNSSTRLLRQPQQDKTNNTSQPRSYKLLKSRVEKVMLQSDTNTPIPPTIRPTPTPRHSGNRYPPTALIASSIGI